MEGSTEGMANIAQRDAKRTGFLQRPNCERHFNEQVIIEIHHALDCLMVEHLFLLVLKIMNTLNGS